MGQRNFGYGMIVAIVAYVVAAAVYGFDPADWLMKVIGMAAVVPLLCLIPFGALSLLASLFKRRPGRSP
ncbi:hypothetical protein SAMN02949497_3513 [Methylomagnum ishizawai]|uniref:Uncharacterized protein n=1 Tax=Methylomagnum ishizawai TaxID=1760988 RepID=A0A1Y6CZL3_9GAMM|nr:hypothetical protein SAMN02949497_3513 [Methylomagnum ishizawai]